MFEINNLSISGAHEIFPKIVDDIRGRFVKIFHKDDFEKIGLECNFNEEYYSRSHRGVVRGMHFQTPPYEHVKLVFCVNGEVQDVILDLRKGSPTYAEAVEVKLSAEKGNIIYIPKGVAHGFCALSDSATLVYKVSTVYAPKNDCGILWNSFGFEWATKQAVISARDSSFERMDQFITPFLYE